MRDDDEINELFRRKLVELAAISTKPRTRSSNRVLSVVMVFLVAVAAAIAILLWLIR